MWSKAFSQSTDAEPTRITYSRVKILFPTVNSNMLLWLISLQLPYHAYHLCDKKKKKLQNLTSFFFKLPLFCSCILHTADNEPFPRENTHTHTHTHTHTLIKCTYFHSGFAHYQFFCQECLTLHSTISVTLRNPLLFVISKKNIPLFVLFFKKEININSLFNICECFVYALIKALLPVLFLELL